MVTKWAIRGLPCPTQPHWRGGPGWGYAVAPGRVIPRATNMGLWDDISVTTVAAQCDARGGSQKRVCRAWMASPTAGRPAHRQHLQAAAEVVGAHWAAWRYSWPPSPWPGWLLARERAGGNLAFFWALFPLALLPVAVAAMKQRGCVWQHPEGMV